MRLALLLGMLFWGCTDSVDRDALDQLPRRTTAVYALTFAVAEDVPVGDETIGPLLDAAWRDYTTCVETAFRVEPDLAVIRQFTHIVVPTYFQCPYHNGVCGGEYNRPKQRIILGYETVPEIGPLAFAWHEWSDLLQPETDDKEGRPCTMGL